jgi:hypothetical protein
MFAGEMRKTYALSLIEKFPALPKGRPFPRIDEADIITGLHDRVVDPTKQDQGAAALCCPAAFFYCVLNYKPELYVQYVIDLLTTGKARIGSLEGLSVYSWGEIQRVPKVGTLSLEEFSRTFYGYVSGTPTFN